MNMNWWRHCWGGGLEEKNRIDGIGIAECGANARSILLDGYGFNAAFSLKPDNSKNVFASYRPQNPFLASRHPDFTSSLTHGSGLVTLRVDEEPFYLFSIIDTEKGGNAHFRMSIGDPIHSKFAIGAETLTDLTKDLSETEVIVHCSYVNENVVMRLKLNLMKRVLGGLIMFRGENFKIGIETDSAGFSNALGVDAGLSYQGSTIRLDSLIPVSYEMSLTSSNFGKEIAASYFHETQYLNRKVNFAGRFVHSRLFEKPSNLLILGAAWELTKRSVLKGRMDTEGKIFLLFGWEKRFQNLQIGLTFSGGISPFSSTTSTVTSTSTSTTTPTLTTTNTSSSVRTGSLLSLSSFLSVGVGLSIHFL